MSRWTKHTSLKLPAVGKVTLYCVSTVLVVQPKHRLGSGGCWRLGSQIGPLFTHPVASKEDPVGVTALAPPCPPPLHPIPAAVPLAGLEVPAVDAPVGVCCRKVTV